jgi:hypothetical protein
MIEAYPPTTTTSTTILRDSYLNLVMQLQREFVFSSYLNPNVIRILVSLLSFATFAWADLRNDLLLSLNLTWQECSIGADSCCQSRSSNWLVSFIKCYFPLLSLLLPMEADLQWVSNEYLIPSFRLVSDT